MFLDKINNRFNVTVRIKWCNDWYAQTSNDFTCMTQCLYDSLAASDLGFKLDCVIGCLYGAMIGMSTLLIALTRHTRAYRE